MWLLFLLLLLLVVLVVVVLLLLLLFGEVDRFIFQQKNPHRGSLVPHLPPPQIRMCWRTPRTPSSSTSTTWCVRAHSAPLPPPAALPHTLHPPRQAARPSLRIPMRQPGMTLIAAQTPCHHPCPHM